MPFASHYSPRLANTVLSLTTVLALIGGCNVIGSLTLSNTKLPLTTADACGSMLMPMPPRSEDRPSPRAEDRVSSPAQVGHRLADV